MCQQFLQRLIGRINAVTQNMKRHAVLCGAHLYARKAFNAIGSSNTHGFRHIGRAVVVRNGNKAKSLRGIYKFLRRPCAV